jgi:hypothetical protein
MFNSEYATRRGEVLNLTALRAKKLPFRKRLLLKAQLRMAFPPGALPSLRATALQFRVRPSTVSYTRRGALLDQSKVKESERQQPLRFEMFKLTEAAT